MRVFMVILFIFVGPKAFLFYAMQVHDLKVS